jgi:propionyl-CoA carboxylase beta chain
MLLDEGTFVELDKSPGTAPATSVRRRTGRTATASSPATAPGRRPPICVFAQDFTVFGGSSGEVFGEKIVKVMDWPMKIGVPVVGINDSGGARIQEGVVSLGLYGEIFLRNVHASGVVPQISLIMGPCAGGAVYSPAITDFTVMVDKTSHMFITGPDVIKTVTGEDVEFEELGGARTHNTKSGVAHYMGSDERMPSTYVKALLSYLPSNNMDAPGVRDRATSTSPTRTANSTPSSPTRPTSRTTCKTVIEHILDDGEFLEVQRLVRAQHGDRVRPRRGPQRRDRGQPAHAVRRHPRHRRLREGRAVRAHLRRLQRPVLTFVDVPGFLPGTDQEWNGIIRRGAKLIYAYAEATVPKVTSSLARPTAGPTTSWDPSTSAPT